MAIVTGCIKTMKLPKVMLIVFRFRITTAAVVFTKCSYHTESIRSSSNLFKTDNNRFCTNHLRTNKSAESNIKNDIKIDSFRAREEQKEQEYEKENYSAEENTTASKDPSPEQVKIENLRLQILEASLRYVSSYGWTRQAIVHGAESIGYHGITHGIFPDGGGAIELIRYFYDKCNQELAKKLSEETKNGEIIPDKPIEFLIQAIKIRLQMIEPYLEYWPQAMAIMGSPQNILKSFKQLATLIDDICYYSGDRSVNFVWYTRRMGLVTVYKTTELFMLQDTSINREETWKFLAKRIEEGTKLESICMSSNSEGLTIQQKLNVAFETTRNILGLNYNRR